MQETIVRLKVRSPDFTPDQITDAIGIPCDICWRVGDIRAHTKIKEKDNGWVLDSNLPRNAALEEHIDALLCVLDSRADAIKSLPATAKMELSCVIYAETVPALNFEASVIAKFARLNLGLDLDLYLVEGLDTD